MAGRRGRSGERPAGSGGALARLGRTGAGSRGAGGVGTAAPSVERKAGHSTASTAERLAAAGPAAVRRRAERLAAAGPGVEASIPVNRDPHRGPPALLSLAAGSHPWNVVFRRVTFGLGHLAQLGKHVRESRKMPVPVPARGVIPGGVGVRRYVVAAGTGEPRWDHVIGQRGVIGQHGWCGVCGRMHRQPAHHRLHRQQADPGRRARWHEPR